jgi:putative intracellular protease/amidase
MDAAPESSARALGTASVLLALAAGGALIGAAFAGDASGVRGILPVGGAAVVVVTVALVAVGLGLLDAPRIGRTGLALVVVLGVLGIWLAASISWSIAPDRSWDTFNRCAAVLAFLALGMLLAGAAGRAAARLGAVVLTVATSAVLVWALVEKVFPGLDPGGDRVARLREPIGYWNALALLANVALALGLWLGAARGHRALVRIAGALVVYVATLALLLTLSRSGLMAGVAVVVLWVAVARERIEGGLVLAAGVIPAALVAGWAYMRPALVEDMALRADREADGAVLGVLALGGAVLVAAVVALAVRRPLGAVARDRVARGLVVVAVVGAAAALAGVVYAVGNTTTSSVSCAETVNDPSRLGSFSLSNRVCWWREARDVYSEHAPLGAGAGTFELARRADRLDARNVSQPHSVPLQQLADAGIAGAGLWIALLLAGALACVGALRRLEGPERAAAAALVAAPAAFLLHSLVDYSWDFLAVTAPTVLALGVLAAAGREPREPRLRPLVAVAAILLAVVALVSFASPRLSDRDVRASTRALDDEDFTRSRELAERARLFNPYSPEPFWALARRSQRLGYLRAAEAHLVDAVELQPENPETWYRLGMFEYDVLQNLCAAYEFLQRSWNLDPAGVQWEPNGPLDVSRLAVGEGACEPR